VLGDEPKGLYVPEETARQIKQCLLPIADLATRMHSNSLGSPTVPSPPCAKQRAAAQGLAAANGARHICPAAGDRLATLLHDATGTVFTSLPVDEGPSGTGDLLAGLFTGALASGSDARTALAYASARLRNGPKAQPD